jgi:hypothetical protein
VVFDKAARMIVASQLAACVTSGFRREVEKTALFWVIAQRVGVIS